MNIVIAGIGKFGKELTEQLVKENHNITLIDNHPFVLEEIVNQFDVMGYCGNAASYSTQLEAQVAKADLFIATTSNDETNILSCLVAKKIGVPETISRLRNPEYAIQAQLMGHELGVSMSLNPDLDTAREIYRILRFPSAIKVDTFANGKVDLVEIKIVKDSLLCDKSLAELRDKYDVNFLVCAVERGKEVIIPKGDFILKENDYVYVTATPKALTNSFKKLKSFKNTLKSAMIIGGSKITYYLTNLLLEAGIFVKIIEQDLEVCKMFSKAYPSALVIHGDATNHKLLIEEGIENIDSFITLTGMDETNIILSSYAEKLKCDKVITKVNNPSYDMILNSIGLESVIAPKEIFANNIIRYTRGMINTKDSEFKTLYRLVEDRVEALEFVISKETNYTSIPLKDLKIKNGFLLASIIRANKVIIPSGNDTLEPLDSIIIVTTQKSVKDVSEILE